MKYFLFFLRKNKSVLSDDELGKLLDNCEKIMGHMEASLASLDESLNKFAAVCDEKDPAELKKSLNSYLEKIDVAIEQAS